MDKSLHDTYFSRAGRSHFKVMEQLLLPTPEILVSSQNSVPLSVLIFRVSFRLLKSVIYVEMDKNYLNIVTVTGIYQQKYIQAPMHMHTLIHVNTHPCIHLHVLHIFLF